MAGEIETATAAAANSVDHGMTWLEFIAAMFGSLVSIAWPAALVLSVWIFRKEIRPLLPRMRLRHKETEFSFRLDEAERAMEQLPPPANEEELAPPEEISHFEKIARLSPRAALMDMRREVENVLLKAAERLPKKSWEISVNTRRINLSPRQILRLLRANNKIDPTAANLFEDVLAIGNIAAHDDAANYSFEDAMRYRNVVDHAMRFFETPSATRPEDGLDLPPQK